jgi:hypothetical protein
LEIKCPNYTTLCKRQKNLEVDLWDKIERQKDEPMHLVIDSTGLKVFGEGEWKVRQHGYSKRRTWRKIHLGVDAADHFIEAAVVTTNDFKDSEIVPDLMGQIDEDVDQVSADGGYDSHDTYEYIDDLGARPVIIPRKDAVITQHGNCRAPPRPRDEVVRAIRKKGRKNWEKSTDYHKRSLAETAMYRFKTLFGNTLSARTFERQAVEALLKCAALNRITSLGMPDTVAL